MKKKHIAALTVSLVILLGVVIGVMVINGPKDRNSDYIIHEKDDDAVEIETENGLKQSESEDGPVLDEDNMIDFNSGNFNNSEESDKHNTTDKEDDKTDVTPDKDSGNEDYTEEPLEGDTDNPEIPEEPDVPETGAWGNFY